MPSEAAVGISAFSTPGSGFLAATKQRFSDFIVREVDSVSGLPVRLTALPDAPPSEVAVETSAEPIDLEAQLISVIGQEHATAVMALLNDDGSSGGGGGGAIVLPRDDDKEQRKLVHKLFKQPALQSLVTDTVDTPCGGKSVRVQSLAASAREHKEQQAAAAAAGGSNKRQKTRNNNSVHQAWPAEAGEKSYLGFTLYKENRDSVDALSRLARGLGVGQNLFMFAGTKDKRGITTQRVNAYKLHPDKLIKLMAKQPFGDSIVVGDLRYEEVPLRLGMHGGNRFTIVLRDCSCSEGELEQALSSLQAVGFVNYFGLQRFGASDDAATHKLGIALLKSDFHSVLEMILSVGRDGERSEEAAARELWRTSKDASAVLKILPKRMNIERQLLEGVVKHGLTNPLGALSKLPKSLRSMYLHAFQSYLFNHAASARVALYGCDKAVEGDLVGAESATEAAADDEGAAGSGSSGGGASEEAAASGDGKSDFLIPHVVTAEEAASSKYTIEDVLLPLPGFKTIMPTNEIAAEYGKLMKEVGLDESMMDHKVKELSLSGSYRKFLQKPIEMEWRILKYDDPQLPLTATDLSRLRGEPDPEGVVDGKRTAAVLEFTLPASTYATMCLRELTKQSTELSHQMQLNARAEEGAAAAQPQQPAAE